ncbi:unnamed protein product [Clavelina lepadiformis]|uniref:Uncharacterized protein n=1 Tax=Clavelina lepadiformis TaxID=159417 RepID=A0ABP0FSN1_CLALP
MKLRRDRDVPEQAYIKVNLGPKDSFTPITPIIMEAAMRDAASRLNNSDFVGRIVGGSLNVWPQGKVEGLVIPGFCYVAINTDRILGSWRNEPLNLLDGRLYVMCSLLLSETWFLKCRKGTR